MNWTDRNDRAAFVDVEIDRALRAVRGNTEDIRDAVARAACQTDSPIEAQFAAWFDIARGHQLSLGNARFAVRLKPQPSITVQNGATYRLDFVLEPLDDWLRGALQSEHLELRVGVELDGHDFHERTREQVTYRNQRDRDLTEARWRVLHFSGSELNRNPMSAVIEALVAGADALDQAKAALRHG